MKETNVKDRVPARCWYYLLEFNDLDGWETMWRMFSKERLLDLTFNEFWELFYKATGEDFATKDTIEYGDKKTTIDDKEVPDRCWQYLKSFNERDNGNIMLNLVIGDRVYDLTFDNFWKYFEFVTKLEFESKGNYFV